MKYTNFYSLKFNNVKISKVVISMSLLFGTVILHSCGENKPAVATAVSPTLPVATINSATEITYQDYPAAIEGSVNLEVRPQISGILDKIYVDEGAFVHAGQPLFSINDQPFKAALNNAKAAQHAAEAALINAELEVERFTVLEQNKVISDFQLKSAKATAQLAKANIQQAKANVETATINLSYTLIKAPVSGYLGRLLKKQGSLVNATDVEPLTQLSDIQNIHVYFSLGEKDFVNFKNQYAGNTLDEKIKHLPAVKLILTDNIEYNKTGKIDIIDGQFDKNTGSIMIRAKFPNAEGLLRSGNTGKIRLSLEHHDALLVPQSATIEVQDKTFVYTMTSDNKVKRQAITIVGKSEKNYLVKDGIKNGDQIVLSGLDRLQEGTVITPEKNAEKVAIVTKK